MQHMCNVFLLLLLLYFVHAVVLLLAYKVHTIGFRRMPEELAALVILVYVGIGPLTYLILYTLEPIIFNSQGGSL